MSCGYTTYWYILIFLYLNWISFLIVVFWLILFIFALNSYDLITITIYSETLWVVLYSITTVIGIQNDDLLITTTSVFLLALAGLEFCFGFLITIFFKNLKKSFNICGGKINLQKKQTNRNNLNLA